MVGISRYIFFVKRIEFEITAGKLSRVHSALLGSFLNRARHDGGRLAGRGPSVHGERSRGRRGLDEIDVELHDIPRLGRAKNVVGLTELRLMAHLYKIDVNVIVIKSGPDCDNDEQPLKWAIPTHPHPPSYYLSRAN